MSDAPTSTTAASASSPEAPRHPPRSRLALFCLALALVAGLLALLSGLGSRWGLWHFRTGFTLLRWAAYGGLVAGILSLVSIYRTRPHGPRRGLTLAVLALVISTVIVVVPWQWRLRAGNVPPIHDITTDTEDPPQFVAIVPLRADAPNPVEYGGPEIAAQQREAYPDIRPVIMDLPPQRAFQRALDTAHDMGWEIVASEPEAGRIEATDQTRWFGFKDDVVIRITPVNSRSLIDVRSVSRVGRSDVGTNARRIREYLQELRAQ